MLGDCQPTQNIEALHRMMKSENDSYLLILVLPKVIGLLLVKLIDLFDYLGDLVEGPLVHRNQLETR